MTLGRLTTAWLYPFPTALPPSPSLPSMHGLSSSSTPVAGFSQHSSQFSTAMNASSFSPKFPCAVYRLSLDRILFLVSSGGFFNIHPNLELSGISSFSRACYPKSSSALFGKAIQIPYPKKTHVARSSSTSQPVVTMTVKPVIQFIQGTDELTVPDVKLTKSRDGTNGVATFVFEEPSVFESSSELGEITGFFMIDEEGVLQSTNVSAKFVNGKPSSIEAKYIMLTPRDWDRFMRFMERYSNANGLQFIKK